MRKVFLLIILANIGFLLWTLLYGNLNESAQPEEEINMPVVQLQNSAGIVLVRERQLVAKQAETPTNKASSQKLLGGFSEESRALALRQRLLTLNIAGSVIHKSQTVIKEYIVYVPPLPSLRLALRKQDELERRGFSSSVIQDGEMKYALEVARYVNEQAASNMLERLSQSRIDSDLQAVEDIEQAYWVEIEQDSVRLLDEIVLDSLKKDFVSLRFE